MFMASLLIRWNKYAQALEPLRKPGPMKLPSGFSTGAYQVCAESR